MKWALSLLVLLGCSTPEFEDPIYFHKDKPGPVAKAQRDELVKRLGELQAIRVKMELIRAHAHKHATNNIIPLPISHERRH